MVRMRFIKSAPLMRMGKSTLAGIACGVCCAGCVALFMVQVNGKADAARAEALARYGGEQIEVCVASRDIAAGETLSESMIDTKLWLADLLPEGAVTSRGEIVGKQVGSGILEGEVISTQRLGRQNASLDIPEGMTAVSVPAQEVQAVGGVLQAGMRADVYAVGSSSTALLASNVLVLATSLGAGESLMSASVAWVTLAVSPESVQELVAAAQNLQLYFTLPNAAADAGDGAVADALGADAVEADEAATGAGGASSVPEGGA